MTQSPFIRREDAERKGFDFSPWGGIEGFLKASQAGMQGNYAMLKRLVPDLAHAVDMVAVGVSSLPFEIADEESGEIVDISEDWQNVIGGMENPQRLIYLLASSLCGGAAYVIPTRTPRMIFDLQYAAPHTITPQIFREGLQYFDRASDQGKTERFRPKELIYFWLPDSDVEIGPALNHPLGNAALDAQLVWNLKNTMKKYGERGFVPITLLGAKGMPVEGERQKAEAFFDRLLRGGFEVLAKIVNSEALSLVRVGAGMDELKQSYLEIRRDAKESIADAFGIPPALFMSDNAYASEFIELRKQMYTSSRFVSIYQCIQETFSLQLHGQYGKSFRFTPESMDIFQEDESKRSTSLNSFVSALSTDPNAAVLGMSVLGYDLDAEQQGLLDKYAKEKAAEKEEEKKQQQEQMEQNAELQHEALNSKQPPVGKALSADELKDLVLWYSKAKVWFGAGKSAVEWENKHLREEIAAPIRLKLADAKTEADIAAAFQMEQISGVKSDNEAALVLEGIRLALTK